MLKNLKESLLLPRPHPKTPPTRILLGSTIREREMSESRRSITRESCDRQFILIRLPVNLQRQVAISFGRCDVIEAQRGYLIISFPPPSPFHSFSLSLFLSFSLSLFLAFSVNYHSFRIWQHVIDVSTWFPAGFSSIVVSYRTLQRQPH